jgi:hypothetical protein
MGAVSRGLEVATRQSSMCKMGSLHSLRLNACLIQVSSHWMPVLIISGKFIHETGACSNSHGLLGLIR